MGQRAVSAEGWVTGRHWGRGCIIVSSPLEAAVSLLALVWFGMSCFPGKTKEEENDSFAGKEMERLLSLYTKSRLKTHIQQADRKLAG